MQLVPVISWQTAGAVPQPLDARLLPLLTALRTHDSLTAAAGALGISYRAAWDLLRGYQRRAAIALVSMHPGRGAQLTHAGEALLEADAAVRTRADELLAQFAVDLGAPAADAAPIAALRVVASHDPALALLRDALPLASGIRLDVAFKGSLEALAQYDAGNAEIAGFHMPVGRGAATARAPFLRWLRRGRDRLIHFVEREQGLMLPHGNPRRVHTLRDVAAKHLVFVNRQRGSGTRLLIDALLAEERIDTASLRGYAGEEHTHSAIAAIVASGRAEAGFGVRAAAAEYGLAFVPLARERYYLAVRTSALATPPLASLIAVLRGAMFAALVARLAGYDARGAGALVPQRALPLTASTAARAARDARRAARRTGVAK